MQDQHGIGPGVVEDLARPWTCAPASRARRGSRRRRRRGRRRASAAGGRPGSWLRRDDLAHVLEGPAARSGGSCQVARVTRVSSSGGKPTIRSRWPGMLASARRSRYPRRPRASRLRSPMLTVRGEPRPRRPLGIGRELAGTPVNRWSFWHVRELLPTPVSRVDGPGAAAPGRAEGPTSSPSADRASTAQRATVGQVLEDTWTDAYAVLQDGRARRRGVRAGWRPRADPRGPLGHQVAGGLRRRDPGRPRGARRDEPSSSTSPSCGRAGTPAPPCGTCWTCAAACASARTTRTRVPTSEPMDEWRPLASAGCTRSCARSAPSLRTAAGSSTAHPRPTCSAGRARERRAPAWPT